MQIGKKDTEVVRTPYKFRLAYNHSNCPSPTQRPDPPKWLSNYKNIPDKSSSSWINYNYWTKIYWATPPWLTKEMLTEMKRIYENTKPGEHVDHIVPLKGTTVCGLHVPWNLQVLPEKTNIAKSNHNWPDSWNEQLTLF